MRKIVGIKNLDVGGLQVFQFMSFFVLVNEKQLYVIRIKFFVVVNLIIDVKIEYKK